MRIPGRKAAIRTGRWLRSRFGPRAMILGYHRVANTPSDPFGLAVHPQRFRRHLEVIRERARPVRLGDLSDSLEAGQVPDRAVAVTLDDGYTDNLEHAKPALEACGVPATVFVIAGGLGREMWWDEITRLFDADTEGGPLQEAHDRLYAMTPADRERELEVLRSRAAHRTSLPEPRRLLDAAGLEKLAAGGIVEIGAHSLTHRRIAELGVDEQRDEISRSRAALEDLLGRSIETFAFPHGSESRVSRTLAREAGYRCACASQPDVVVPGANRFALPRFWPSDLDEHGLARLLDRWLGSA